MKTMSLGAAIAAGVALQLAACGGTTSAPSDAAAPSADGAMAKIECKESNSCKGNGSCAGVAMGEKHSCAGQNTCGGNVRSITKEECDALGGEVLASN